MMIGYELEFLSSTHRARFEVYLWDCLFTLLDGRIPWGIPRRSKTRMNILGHNCKVRKQKTNTSIDQLEYRIDSVAICVLPLDLHIFTSRARIFIN